MTTSQPIPKEMELSFQEEQDLDFFTFQVWLGHYADARRENREEKYQQFLIDKASTDSTPKTRSAAKAVYKWGPRLDITKMPS